MENIRVLIVDDELLIRDLLYDFFTSRDLEITTCNDTHDALQLLEDSAAFDVVLTDIRMEGEDGLSLVDKIRDVRPGIPVIIMTGYPSVETAVEALRRRVFDYVIKPFNINRLYNTIIAAAKENSPGKGTSDKPSDVRPEYASENFGS
jgi:DNA-binding NtrC family response regulator